MITVSLQQGTDAWHAFRNVKFTASDAAAMLGLSKYKSRDQLLREKKYGIKEEVSPEKQRLFDDGHKTEEMQRPLVEGMIGEELFPATAHSEEWDRIAASFDGITMLEDTIYEHKLWSQKLADYIASNTDLPDTHWPQVEQQLYVAGAAVCFFVVSDGTEENRVILEYVSKPERIKSVLDGWRQFDRDLETYKAKDIKEKPAAEAIRDLPALTYRLDRTTLALQSNLEPFKAAAMGLVEKSRQPLVTDQDFANAEAMVKVFKTTEERLAALIDGIMGEIVAVDVFVKDVRQISESIRIARLESDKKVKSRKEEIKTEIVTNAMKAMVQHIADLNGQIHPYAMPVTPAASVFAEAMKGKKTLKSCHDSVDEAIAAAKIGYNQMSDTIKANAAKYLELATGFEFLFPDIGNMISGSPESFAAIVQNRVNEHKQAEQARLEEQAQKIREQAEADARAKIAAEEQARIKAEAEANKPSATTISDQPCVGDSPARGQDEPMVNSASVAELLSPSIAARLERIASTSPSATDSVSIDRRDLEELRDKAAKYDALVAAGVDNWSGYVYAMSMLEAAE